MIRIAILNINENAKTVHGQFPSTVAKVEGIVNDTGSIGPDELYKYNS